MYKSKYLKYVKKMKGGFKCMVCFSTGEEIEKPNELNECKSCQCVVCSNCLSIIKNKCPQERKITEWENISRENSRYNNDDTSTKVVNLSKEQEEKIEKQQENARRESEELRLKSEELRTKLGKEGKLLPPREDPMDPFNTFLNSFNISDEEDITEEQLMERLEANEEAFEGLARESSENNNVSLQELRDRIFSQMTFAPLDLVEENRRELQRIPTNGFIPRRIMHIPGYNEDIMNPDPGMEFIYYSLLYNNRMNESPSARNGTFARTPNGTYVFIRENTLF
jgi:hypothetical protein